MRAVPYLFVYEARPRKNTAHERYVDPRHEINIFVNVNSRRISGVANSSVRVLCSKPLLSIGEPFVLMLRRWHPQATACFYPVYGLGTTNIKFTRPRPRYAP